MPKSWKPVVQVGDGGDTEKWSENGLRFATREEAADNARDLMRRWMLVLRCDAHESDDEPNYRWVDGKLEALPTA
jgi:hypothetical protein